VLQSFQQNESLSVVKEMVTVDQILEISICIILTNEGSGLASLKVDRAFSSIRRTEAFERSINDIILFKLDICVDLFVSVIVITSS
jgi:hypothetical protein